MGRSMDTGFIWNDSRAGFDELSLKLKENGKMKLLIRAKTVVDDSYYNGLDFSAICRVRLCPQDTMSLIVEAQEQEKYNDVHLTGDHVISSIRFCALFKRRVLLPRAVVLAIIT